MAPSQVGRVAATAEVVRAVVRVRAERAVEMAVEMAAVGWAVEGLTVARDSIPIESTRFLRSLHG